VHALHVGVERIGRYVQVRYEEAADENGAGLRPAWETTAMAAGPGLPGGGTDPLFTVLFGLAGALNVFLAMLPVSTPVEIAAVGAAHAAFIVRVLLARRAAAAQRAVELERVRSLLLRQGDRQ
jgi:hypothetical protein